ncbi:MAG: sigma-E processing peptidase SpoIIGA [Clostridia bacterium]|nr:sigma-E processing peptidase SpoIIGA [Clostridia bacterium]
MTVYVDVLLTVNLFVNYALLLCSSLIMRRKPSGLRILAGAAVGSIYSLIIFLPTIPAAAELVMRIAAGMLIVLCSFGFGSVRKFLRCYFTFLAVSFVFGGIMLVLWLTVAPTGMVYRSGAVYFDINFAVLAVSTVVCFAIVSVISHFISRKAPKGSIYNIVVTNCGRSVSGTALMDTGNSLVEQFSGYPVIIAEMKSVQSIMPESVKSYIEKGSVNDECDGLRFVAHKTVSGTGLLPAFKPDSIELSSLDRKLKSNHAYIAVTEADISGGEYDFLIGPKIFDEEASTDIVGAKLSM